MYFFKQYINILDKKEPLIPGILCVLSEIDYVLNVVKNEKLIKTSFLNGKAS